MMSDEGKRARLGFEWDKIRVTAPWHLWVEGGGDPRWVYLLLFRSSAGSPLSFLQDRRETVKGRAEGVKLRRAETDFDMNPFLPFACRLAETLNTPLPPHALHFFRVGIWERPPV